jgi:hypothetical protein
MLAYVSTPNGDGFFDFLTALDLEYPAAHIRRLNLRHSHIIDPIRDLLKGARVLDLGAHDGRWSYAAAAAGASKVIGVEGRPELVDRFKEFPDETIKARVKLQVGDFNTLMREMASSGHAFDVILCLGVYYHTMDHYPLLLSMQALGPKLIVMDTDLHRSKRDAIFLETEPTDGHLSSIGRIPGQMWVPVGTPTIPAMTLMAASVGYQLRFVDWPETLAGERPVRDYYRSRNRRYTFHLVPAGENVT